MEAEVLMQCSSSDRCVTTTLEFQVRPSMRIVVGPNAPVYDRPIKHDDVIIVPEFFCKENGAQIMFDLDLAYGGSEEVMSSLRH
jgi:hypothetical protein